MAIFGQMEGVTMVARSHAYVCTCLATTTMSSMMSYYLDYYTCIHHNVALFPQNDVTIIIIMKPRPSVCAQKCPAVDYTILVPDNATPKSTIGSS